MTFKSRNIDLLKRIKYLPPLFGGFKKVKRIHLSRKKINRKNLTPNQPENEVSITNDEPEDLQNDRSDEVSIGERSNTDKE